jgi:two-component system chemotaxis sensor kinase CheA
MMEDHFQTFIDESTELLTDLESALVELEEQPEDSELIGRIFRALHTIKGTSGMFGMDGLNTFTHQLESVFDLVRQGELPVTRELVSLALEGKDQLRLLLAAGENVGPDLEERGKTILTSLQQIVSAAMTVGGTTDSAGASTANTSSAALFGEISHYLALLTEFEMSRVMSCIKKKRNFYHFKKIFPLENLGEDLDLTCKKINTCGEIISSIPSSEGIPQGCLGFEFLFAAKLDLSELVAHLGESPLRVDVSRLLTEGKSQGGQKNNTISRQERIFRIRFSPRAESLKNGLNPIEVIKELRQLGDCYTVAHNRDMPDLSQLNPLSCYTYWDIILSTLYDLNRISDVFIFLEDDREISIEIIDDGTPDVPDMYKRLGEILIERGDISVDELKKVLDKQVPQKTLGAMLVESELVSAEVIESALIEQNYVKAMRAVRQQGDQSSSLRVPAQKLDELVNLVGEMVTAQARLSQCSTRLIDNDLIAIAEEMERLVSELRDTTLNIRMLQIGSTFSKYKRLVRDLGEDLGKYAQLTTSGSETELDKTVIEKLNDPLVHLIRNCIDHGIESPEVRAAAGKPRQGTVHLSAAHAGDSVQIVIEDDGAGLNLQAILAKGIDKGLIAHGSEPGDREIMSLIFAPGFSTAAKVSDISGRGVGLDVVKRSIESLRGSIDIASEPGKGTRFTIRLPLTLAIIESLLVSVGTDRFVLPLTIVEECVELVGNRCQTGHGDLVEVRGQLVPYVDLRERFALGGEAAAIQQAIIMNISGERVGVVVDQVIGEHQAVIKSLGRYYHHVDQISGATILGDGSVALIIDVAKLVQGITGQAY